MTGKANIAYEKITNEIVKALESGIVPWKKPWNVINGLPKNLVTKKEYQGINFLILASQPYASNVWGTFNQWKAKGGFVRKGEKSTVICFWQFFDKKEKGVVVKDEKGKAVKIPMLKYYSVFNAEQIDGINTDEYMPEILDNEFTPIERAEKVISEMTDMPQIFHTGNIACYFPNDDKIHMPQREQFSENAGYYSTLFHELSHSTGHKSRCDRKWDNSVDSSFGSESYSFEELVAELSACFLCSHCGIDQTFDNSAAYIKGWVKKFKEQPKMIIQAASKARKSTEFILGE